ncbi:MAG TPA: 30S ribosomal protein S12 methylthiotransferase RimO, partial [Thermoanaerobaculia bacterium]|nr:30S ribosomal protein S12 methylthiotransferase RimO [Thermoanaerobaculia bacterium]
MSGSAPTPKGRVGMISLGCAKNRVDSEIMLGELRAKGYELAADVDGADTVIVNTCGFVEEARKESIDAILEVAARKAEGEGKRLLVAGCMVNRYGDELQREIPEIDGFVSLDQLRQVDQVVQLGGGPPLPAPSHLVFDHTAPRLLTTRGYAYLKVAEGCNNPCTFCAIPVWRGRFRSRTIDSLVLEAQELEAAGIQELCLIAQDTTRFGEDLDGWESKAERRHGLLRLVEALLARTSIPWIRFLYAYPTTLDRELLRLMGQEPRFCSYLDIPLQHSHPEVLTAMRRGGSAERYRRLLDEARELAPDVFLRTTFITGFPGETEEHFEHLLNFIEAVRFDHLGAFVYSPEEGTPGADLPNRVPRRVARRRWEKLLATQREIALERRQRLVGRRMTALVEGVCEES